MNSNIGISSEARRIAPAGISIVCKPCVVTGVLLKWKVIVALPFDNVSESAAIPFTVKSVGWTVDGSAGSLKLTTKSTGWVVITLLQAGSVVVTEKPTSSLSVKASCWDWLLMVTRPSTHEVRCLVRIAVP